MEIIIGLIIIAVGAFCQSSCYVPINKIKKWSWESYWLVQGVFAWLVFPLLGALLAVPSGHSLAEVYMADPVAALWTMFFGVLWGIGGLTFGLSMRYLGVALGQSIALGTCAGLGTILTPIFTGNTQDLTMPVIVGVVVTLIGIGVIGVAGNMKSQSLSDEEKKKAVKGLQLHQGYHRCAACRIYERMLQHRSRLWRASQLRRRHRPDVPHAARNVPRYAGRLCHQCGILFLPERQEPHMGRLFADKPLS